MYTYSIISEMENEMSDKHGAGKGDKYRPVDQKKWNEGWESAFGSNKTKNKKTKGDKNGSKEKK